MFLYYYIIKRIDFLSDYKKNTFFFVLLVILKTESSKLEIRRMH